jgi:hypothetical protein
LRFSAPADVLRGCSRGGPTTEDVPAESVARASALAVAAGRRPVVLRSSQTFDHPRGCDRWNRSARAIGAARLVEPPIPSLTRSRTTRPLERLRYQSAARHGSFANSRLLRVAFRYPFSSQRCLAGRRRSSLVRRPTALLGFVPFAGLIPPTGGLTRVASDAAKRSGFDPRSFIAASLPVRAHVPFVPLVRPDWFSSG